jgi:glycosyltransferase involved in cell wall biosynthesis
MYHPNRLFFGWSIGGSEKRFMELSKHLTRFGFSIHTIEPYPSNSRFFKAGYIPFEINLHHKFFHGPVGTNLTMFLWYLKGLQTGIKLCKKNRYDIVLAHNGTLFDLVLGGLISHIYHIPYVVVIHHLRWVNMCTKKTNAAAYNFFRCYHLERSRGSGSIDAFLRSIGAFFELKLLHLADFFICVSLSTAKYLELNGLPTNKMRINGNGVDLDYISSFPTPQKKEYDAVYVGRLSGSKGIFDLLNAWKIVGNIKKNLKLVIIGGSDAPANKQKIISQKYGLKNLIFTGFVTDADLIRCLKSSRVFVFPSKLEGWGIAVAEAIACGLPVVMYDIPPLKENFSEYEGAFFVPVGDIECFAETIVHVLSLSESSMLELETHSKDFLYKFNWIKVAQNESEILRECAGIGAS